MACRCPVIIIGFPTLCDHLQHIKSEFRGQRMLQHVVTKGHNSVNVKEVPFLTGAQLTISQKSGKQQSVWLVKLI